MRTGEMVIVRCPMGFANRLLQNSIGRVLYSYGGITGVSLLSGPEAGRTWQFGTSHLRLLPRKCVRHRRICAPLTTRD